VQTVSLPLYILSKERVRFQLLLLLARIFINVVVLHNVPKPAPRLQTRVDKVRLCHVLGLLLVCVIDCSLYFPIRQQQAKAVTTGQDVMSGRADANSSGRGGHVD
jgi:hypothetical protein